MKLFFIILVVAIIIFGGVWFFGSPVQAPTENDLNLPPPQNTRQEPPREETSREQIIEFTEKGYAPSAVTITAGTTVIFKNTIGTPTWPASAKHPTHTVYPGSDIKKCGTGEESKIFDACRGLAKGETFSFVFNEKGTWAYHDHLNSTLFGKITVE